VSDEVSIDLNEFTQLAGDLRKSELSIANDVRKIIQVGSMKIKKQMASDIGKSPHFKAVAPSITFTTKITALGIESEIGPEIGKAAGSLAFIAAHGTSTMGPSWDYAAPLIAEAKVVENLLLKAVGKIL
jgi:hypothetical protein